MRYDTVIIGGGLSGLICGIELARKGKQAAIVATGHSTLHFSSGSFGLLSKDSNGNAIDNPLEAIKALDANHPYSKIGADRVAELADVATQCLNIAEIATNGSTDKNHFIATPPGTLRCCWRSIDGMLTSECSNSFDFKSVALFNFDGFIDFYTEFIASQLRGFSLEVSCHSVEIPELVVRRDNPTEMRSTTIARALDKIENIEILAKAINDKAGEAQVVILPAVLGLYRKDTQALLEKAVNRKVLTINTVPPSVEGIKMERALKSVFKAMGGTIFTGHTVVNHTVEDNTITSITTSKDVTVSAEHFVLATGSFIGGGLDSTRQEGIFEPIFGADIEQKEEQYTLIDIFESQPFMCSGVATDNSFKVLKNGTAIDNLYACGAILSGYNPVKEGSGAGVAMLTAIAVAENILNR